MSCMASSATVATGYEADDVVGQPIIGDGGPALAQDTTVARTIRFPASLRERIANDAERCGRSFEGQVLALLRRHYGEDVDIAPSPNDILGLATASLADVPAADARALVRRLGCDDLVRVFPKPTPESR
jgi:hypothetical protein